MKYPFPPMQMERLTAHLEFAECLQACRPYIEKYTFFICTALGMAAEDRKITVGAAMRTARHIEIMLNFSDAACGWLLNEGYDLKRDLNEAADPVAYMASKGLTVDFKGKRGRLSVVYASYRLAWIEHMLEELAKVPRIDWITK